MARSFLPGISFTAIAIESPIQIQSEYNDCSQALVLSLLSEISYQSSAYPVKEKGEGSVFPSPTHGLSVSDDLLKMLQGHAADQMAAFRVCEDEVLWAFHIMNRFSPG